MNLSKARKCTAYIQHAKKSLIDAIKGAYRQQVLKLVQASRTTDNNAETELNAGEIDEDRSNKLKAMFKLPSTREFVKIWQVVAATLTQSVPSLFTHVLGSAGQAEAQDCLASFDEALQPVRRTYATLTCCQAALRKLKGQESRQALVDGAKAVAESWNVQAPPQSWRFSWAR